MQTFNSLLEILLPNLPWLILNIFLFVYYIKVRKAIAGKFYNPILVAAVVLGILGILYQIFIHYNMRSTSDYHRLYLWSVLFYSSGYLTILGVISFFIEEKYPTSYRQSLWGLFFLTLFTFGLYIGYWHLKRSIQFNPSAIVKATFIFLAYFLFMMLCLRLQRHMGQSDQAVIALILLCTQILFVITAWISLFSIRAGILRAGGYCDPIGTFLLGPLYLQYKINELDDFKKVTDQHNSINS